MGVDYSAYEKIYGLLKQAESYSDKNYKVKVKWSKIKSGENRSYNRCYGAPFMIQISGSGLVAPCGMLFNEKYKRYHIGNITQKRFKDIWKSEEYWEVMNHLASAQFDAKTMCGTLCLQHKVNEALDNHVKGVKTFRASSDNKKIPHINFI